MFNKTQSKSEYEAPQIEVFKICVERGFHISGHQQPETINCTENVTTSSNVSYFSYSF